MYVCMYVCVYIYIYIYIKSPHWINKHPLILFYPPNDLFYYSFTIKKARHIQILAKTLLIIFPPSWGDPFARIKYGTFI